MDGDMRGQMVRGQIGGKSIELSQRGRISPLTHWQMHSAQAAGASAVQIKIATPAQRHFERNTSKRRCNHIVRMVPETSKWAQRKNENAFNNTIVMADFSLNMALPLSKAAKTTTGNFGEALMSLPCPSQALRSRDLIRRHSLFDAVKQSFGRVVVWTKRFCRR
jgi:hypothetical protein